jgi:hypothetical protein
MTAGTSTAAAAAEAAARELLGRATRVHTLPDGRDLAYAECGDAGSPHVLLFLHPVQGWAPARGLRAEAMAAQAADGGGAGAALAGSLLAPLAPPAAPTNCCHPRRVTLPAAAPFPTLSSHLPRLNPPHPAPPPPHHPNSNRLMSLTFDADARRLGLRVLAPERPGYGRSTPQPGRGVGGFVRDLSHLLAALGVERFAVLGSSAGSMVRGRGRSLRLGAAWCRAGAAAGRGARACRPPGRPLWCARAAPTQAPPCSPTPTPIPSTQWRWRGTRSSAPASPAE